MNQQLSALEIMMIMDKAKEIGAQSFKAGQIEVSFSQPVSLVPAQESIKDEPIEDVVVPLSVLDDYSEEEIKYFATPYFDELMAKKQARTEQLNTEEK